MDAKELRIGNYVSNPPLMPVRCIDHLDIRDHAEGRLIQPFEAIKLNEEWLLRLGFRFYNGKTTGDMTMDTVCKIDMDYRHKRIMIKSHYEGAEMYRDMKHIEFVHQLQNLYYSLTGSELTIKEQ